MKRGPKPLPTVWTVEAYDHAFKRMGITGNAVRVIRLERDALRAVGAHQIADRLHGCIKSAEGAHNHAVRLYMSIRSLATPEQLAALGRPS